MKTASRLGADWRKSILEIIYDLQFSGLLMPLLTCLELTLAPLHSCDSASLHNLSISTFTKSAFIKVLFI